MTREEASQRIQTLRLKIAEPTDTKLGWLETWIHKEDEEALSMAIKALEQEPKSEWEQDHAILKAHADGANEILDKIRAEIEQRPYEVANDSVIQGMKYERNTILEILDKYKSESEE